MTMSRLYHATNCATIEEWLAAEVITWGTRMMTLLTHMDVQWDMDILDATWVGIASSAMKQEGLVDPEGRKLPDELIKRRLDK